MRRFFEKYPLVTVFVFMTLCLLPVIILRDFSPANELKYVSMADEALANGQVFAFTNHGVPYADKPPLYLWIVILGRLLFGSGCMPFLASVSLLSAFLTVMVMDKWIRESSSSLRQPCERASVALALLTCSLFLGCSVFLRMDMLMCLFIMLALRSFWRMYEGRDVKRESYLFPIWIFLAVFTKGPVGLLMPPVTVICFLLLKKQGRTIGEYLGWKTWGIIAGLCAVWFAGVFIDGGKEYLNELLFHQTFGRAVNSFHHKAPLWYYLMSVWYSVAPYCLLLVGALVASFMKPVPKKSDLETFFIVGVIATFAMLSAFSGKLAIYLLPVFPLMVYVFPMVEERFGWRGWMKWSLAVPAALLSVVGLAGVTALLFLKDMDPVAGLLGKYPFVTSPLVIVSLAILAIGMALAAAMAFGKGGAWHKPVSAIACTLLLAVFGVSFLMPKANDFIGLGSLCELIPDGAEVVGLNLRGADNMDVYLGRPVRYYGRDFDAFKKDMADEATSADYLVTDSDRFRKVPGLKEYVSSKPHVAKGTWWLVPLNE